MIDLSRVRRLNDRPADPAGRYVLYWMQASQREAHNDALEYAIHRANELRKPLVVCFGLMDDYPEANERHYAFMLEGLADVSARLAGRGIRFVCKHGHPAKVALHYAKGGAACLLVCDVGYTRHQRAWRDEVAAGAGCEVVAVEADAVVPVAVASDKHEFAARTIRPRIHRQWERYLKPLAPTRVEVPSAGGASARGASAGAVMTGGASAGGASAGAVTAGGASSGRASASGASKGGGVAGGALAAMADVRGDLDVSEGVGLLSRLKVNRSVPRTSHYTGGQTQAERLMGAFIERTLAGYGEGRNEPAAGATSRMSMYLQFGMVSPVWLALKALEAKAPEADRDSYIEELIVRRELSCNFCWYNPHYDRYEGLPAWARKTLAEHAADKRPVIYDEATLEAGRTHDPYWNAAQLEMVRTGFMHNYMRMYWGKKILEWTRSPEEGFEITLRLNNKWFLCGRGPNAFANVGWVYGLHDRPWTQRPIFGTIRYMNAAGLERKFDIDAYVKKVALLG